MRLHLQTLRIGAGWDHKEAVDPAIDSLAAPNERTYRCVLKGRDGNVVLTTSWTGEPPRALFVVGGGDPTATPREGATRFERAQYRPRVLLVVYEEGP